MRSQLKNLKGVGLLIVLLIVCMSLLAQEKLTITLPLYLEPAQEDFYIKQVFDRRTDQKQMGLVQGLKKDQTISVVLKNGLIPEFSAFFNHVLPYDTGKFPVTVMVKKLDIAEEEKDTTIYGVAQIALDFFLEKEGALVRVYKAEAYKKIAVSDKEQGYALILAVAISDCLGSFSRSNWQRHSYYVNRYQNDRITDMPGGDTNTKAYPAPTQMSLPGADLLFSRSRISVGGGYGYWLLDLPDRTPGFVPESFLPNYQDYIKGLRSGYNVALSYCYYFRPGYGLGIQYADFRSSNKIHSVPVIDTAGQPLPDGDLSHRINITYMGMTASGRTFAWNNQMILSADLSAGYFWYKEDYQFLPYESNLFREGNFGLNAGLGIEYIVGKYMSLGIVGTYYYGKIDEINGIPLEEDFDLSHFTFNLALRIYR